MLLWKILAVFMAAILTACSAGSIPVQPTTQPDSQPTNRPPTGVSGELLASSKPRAAQPAVEQPDLDALTGGNTQFALELYQAIRAEGGNLFFSPYSISVALAMTEAGAREKTLTEMDQMLHYALPQDRLHSAVNALEQKLTALGKETQFYLEPGAPTPAEPLGFYLSIANSIWGQKDYNFQLAYLDTLAENYGAGLRLWDFANDAENGRAAINAWVSEQTREKIKDLIPAGAINPLTRLVLANAIYFKASWLHPFESAKTRAADFHQLNGSTVKAEMMNQGGLFSYAKGEGWQAVELPYISPSYRMIVLVPDEGQFEAVEQTLDADRLDEILGSMQSNQVNLGFPKFEHESSVSLKKTLTGLGMTQAFTPGQADFSGMTGNKELSIGDVIHKAYIKVDEEGTEAAAATAVIMVASAAPVEPVTLVVDRPFIYLIQERQTGTILFMGRVLEP